MRTCKPSVSPRAPRSETVDPSKKEERAGEGSRRSSRVVSPSTCSEGPPWHAATRTRALAVAEKLTHGTKLMTCLSQVVQDLRQRLECPVLPFVKQHDRSGLDCS